MPIEFEGTTNQRITFANPIAIDNLTTYTLMARINADIIGNGKAPRIYDKAAASSNGWNFGMQDNATASARADNLFFFAGWSGTDGLWETAANTITPGTEHHVAVTYDHGNVANNPIFYIDGVLSAVTETQTPVGSDGDDSVNDLLLGETAAGGGQPFDGMQSDWRIYDWVLPAVDIKSIVDFNSISASGYGYGLIFHVQGIGASGLQAYDGIALSSSNKIVDRINGYLGIPNNSPIGHDEKLRGVRL